MRPLLCHSFLPGYWDGNENSVEVWNYGSLEVELN
jgi:hypothetical protein